MNSVKNRSLNVSAINPDYIISQFQIYTAAVSVLEAEASSSLKTRTIHVELVFRLAASSHITGSIKKFGAINSSNKVIIAVFDANESILNQIYQSIQGEAIPNHDFSTTAQLDLIINHYNISGPELLLVEKRCESVMKSLLSRIATQHL